MNLPTLPLSRREQIQRSALASLVAIFGLLALLSPLLRTEPQGRVGALLLFTAAIEIIHSFRRATAKGQRQAWFDGLLSLMMALLLINAPLLASSALAIFLGIGFVLTAAASFTAAFRRRDAIGEQPRWWLLLRGALNLGAAILLVSVARFAMDWAVAIVAGFRMFRAAGAIATSPVYSAQDVEETITANLGLPDDPAFTKEAHAIAQSERDRVWVDRGWIIGFIATLFAIHVARMGFDRSFLGIFSPAFAVVGDLFVALVLAFIVIAPAGIGWRFASAKLERLWPWALDSRGGAMRAITRIVLRRRLRTQIRMRLARYSMRAALGRGLQTGLPMAAIIAATVPVWGMSWYFDTENWASGVWNSWAEERTETWREAMTRAVINASPANPPTSQPTTHPADKLFAVSPPGTSGDFSFIVIGDTGEGDASQHSLKAAYLNVVERDDVKFVVISSDVVYPTGAMRDYEAKFWIPFHGTLKPVYAIPGNHDWYDALEGFVATFFKPDAARRAMIARIEIDKRITSSNEKHVDHLIATATRLRNEYRIPTQQQDGPYFQIQTDNFALFAIDTGVAKRLDSVQLDWLRSALDSSRGKMKMAILGHPFCAGGYDQTIGDEAFAELRKLLRDNDVQIVMAGDTHDFEYYRETPTTPTTAPTTAPATTGEIHHFVNGGGGAYMSYGTALAFPKTPVTKDWAYFPSTADVTAKIEQTTPWWKRPAWWWTRKAGAWPFSAEFLSAAFDSNVAPFHQSFVEVRVEQSNRRIRIIPHGVNGRLVWKQLDTAASLQNGNGDSYVEWVIELPRN